MAVVTAVVALAGTTARACDRYGRYDREFLSVNVGALPFVNFGFHVHSHQGPCAETVVVAPPPMPMPPQVVYVPAPVPPPQVVYVPTPVPVAPPPPPLTVAAPPPAQVTVVNNTVAPARRDEGPALLAVKYQPGANSAVTLSDSLTLGAPSLAHNLGVEVRLAEWFALRSDFERRSDTMSIDFIGAKLSLPTQVVSPYLSGSLSASTADATPGKFGVGLVAAAGLDVKIGRHFFLEAEARYRVAPDACCREVPQVTGLVGGGFAFF